MKCLAFLVFTVVVSGCASKAKSSSASPTETGGFAATGNSSANEKIVHNDDEVRAKIKTLCPFSLEEMDHGRVSRLGCDGVITDRVSKSVSATRGQWSVKDNELILDFVNGSAKGKYSIDVMKDQLYVDGVVVSKKSGLYQIDAPD